jgi:hypothetical protein
VKASQHATGSAWLDGREAAAIPPGAAGLARRLPADFPNRDLWKPITLLAAAIVPLVVIAQYPGTWHAAWAPAIPGALLLALIAVMCWPSAGTRRYWAYKRPLFVFTIVFELWIMVGGLALRVPAGWSDRDFWFQLMLVGFFLGTVVISLPWVEGEYRPGLFFRPDLIYGNGAYLARGEIFVALGIKLFTIKPQPAQPIWNWWGLEWALAAMIFMVPFRGILKMRMRRTRFLDLDNWLGNGVRAGLWVKEAFLYLALILLVYGFANVYMGTTPFTWTPGNPTGTGKGPEWWGLAFLGGAFLIVVPLRAWLKTRLAEPAPLWQELGKNLLAWVGFVILIYGFLALFMGAGWLTLHGRSSPNFWWGVWISVLGFLMLVPLRTYAQRQELVGTLRIMIPRMADLSEEQRRLMMGRRLEVLAALPETARAANLKLMMRIIHELPEEPRALLVRARTSLVACAPEERRLRLMRGMAIALGQLPKPRRAAVLAEVMGSVAELPEEQRAAMMAAMSQLVAG